MQAIIISLCVSLGIGLGLCQCKHTITKLKFESRDILCKYRYITHTIEDISHVYITSFLLKYHVCDNLLSTKETHEKRKRNLRDKRLYFFSFFLVRAINKLFQVHSFPPEGQYISSRN